MKKIALLFLWLPLFVVAQEREMLTVQQHHTKLRYNDTSTSIQSFDLKLRLPLWSRDKHTLIATVGYRQLRLNQFPDLFAKQLYGTTVQMAWLYKVSAKKSLALMAQMGLFSDMKNVSAKDTRYTIALRYRIKHGQHLSTGWGLAYSRQFFGHQLIPFLDLDYHPNDRWTITGQFPVRPKILYHVNKRFSAGMEIAGDASSYRLSATETNNRFIQVQQWTGLLLMEHKMGKAWNFRIGIGRNLKQSYRLYNDTNDAPWTIITIPVGKREEPIRRLDDKGLNIQLGISFNPF